MEPRDNVCLDALSWFESLARLSAWTAAEAPIENALRLSYHLAALAPPPFGSIVACTLDETAFDKLLERQAFEAAAAALIGSALSYEIVSRAESPATVRVWLNGGGGGETAEALASSDTLPTALVRAWAVFLLNQATGRSHKSA